MKRFFGSLALVVIGILCFSGCGKKTAITPITDGFSAQIAVDYKELAVQGDFSCSTDGRVSLAFTYPKSLEGVTLLYDGTAMQMQLGGMSISVDEETLPDGGLIRRLAEVLVAVKPQNGEWQDGDYVISGDVDGIVYTLACDATTGLPKELLVPDEELQVTFSQVTVL